MDAKLKCPPGVEVIGSIKDKEQASILSYDALAFLAVLHRSFNDRRLTLLALRKERQKALDAGEFPTFLQATAGVRADDTWRGAKLAPGLTERRIEITGPVDRKMVINALNSGATQFMADFEDSSAPTWQNMISGQVNMRDALRRTISFDAPNGKHYALKKDQPIATLLVRARGWHLDEKHVIIDGKPCSGGIFDFAMYFFNSARQALDIGAGPYFYLPKLESHLEARLWNDIFNMAQDMLKIPRGTIRATVLIETILAAYEMDEIIYELREHSSGLNCGRWDYIFSVIKKFWKHPGLVLPDRKLVTMSVPFMDAYVRLVIKTCHRRGVHAMGGMAAQIPIKDDPTANAAAMEKVRQDKLREAKYGHDGTWVAHPDLIPIAKKVFDDIMPGPNQIHVRREESISPSELLNTRVEGGVKVTEEGLRSNVSVALVYMENWLRGLGCVPINYLMEDAATAEISRSQLWQWIHHKTSLTTSTGQTRVVTPELVRSIIDEEVSKLKASPELTRAKEVLIDMVVRKQDSFVDFLTGPCYEDVLEPEAKKRATRSRM